jgi:hypothetical protein
MQTKHIAHDRGASTALAATMLLAAAMTRNISARQ